MRALGFESLSVSSCCVLFSISNMTDIHILDQTKMAASVGALRVMSDLMRTEKAG